MSRILLISTNTNSHPYPVYPLGMSIAAAILQRDGHVVKQADWLRMNKDECVLTDLMRGFAPDCVALSIRNIDSCDSMDDAESAWELDHARLVARVSRKILPDIPIIIGGPAVSVMPKELLDYVQADVAVPGECENAITRAVELAIEKKDAQFVFSESGRAVRSDEFIAPLYDRDLLSFYKNNGGIIGLQTKRGCPFRCSYCTYQGIEGRGIRDMPVEMLADVLEKHFVDENREMYFFADSVFNDPAGKYLKLAEELLRRDISIPWCAFFSPNNVDEESIKLCKRAGLYAVELGTDASTDATLAGMNKPFGWREVQHAEDVFARLKVYCAHYIVFGGPDETPDTVSEGLRNIENLDKGVVFAFSGLRIYPGTFLRERAVREGVIGENESLFRPVYYISPHVDKLEMEATLLRAFDKRNDRVFPPSEGERIVKMLRSAGFKGLLWDRWVDFTK